VRRRGNRQELGESLDDAENDGLEERQSGRSIARDGKLAISHRGNRGRRGG
jgi:hypothetical protein